MRCLSCGYPVGGQSCCPKCGSGKLEKRPVEEETLEEETLEEESFWEAGIGFWCLAVVVLIVWWTASRGAFLG
jgi:hypothetical protein